MSHPLVICSLGLQSGLGYQADCFFSNESSISLDHNFSKTGLTLAYLFCSEISHPLPGNMRDQLLLHEEQPPFAQGHSLRYKKNHIKNIISLPCHSPGCTTAPKTYQATKRAGLGTFMLISECMEREPKIC